MIMDLLRVFCKVGHVRNNTSLFIFFTRFINTTYLKNTNTFLLFHCNFSSLTYITKLAQKSAITSPMAVHAKTGRL